MAPALLISWLGLLWVNYIYNVWLVRGLLFVSALLVAGVIYFLRSSYNSARVLSRVRVSILQAIADERSAVPLSPIEKPVSE